MKRLAALLALVLVLGVPAVGAGEPEGSAFTAHEHPGVNGSPALTYWVYRPARLQPPKRRAVVVYLHGCTQAGPDAAVGTRWNELADREGIVVVYPEQSTAYNGTQCWNWFLPDHQTRGAGEPATIAAITDTVVRAYKANPGKIYVIGASAGADMATIVAATYPDRFAAVAAFAGCAYLSCADVTGAAAHAAMGPHARVVPALIGQGTADPLNNPLLGETAVRQWVGTNDLADDGEANGSVPATPSRTEHRGMDDSLADGAGTVGDTCVRNKQFPCAGAVLGLEEYPVTIRSHDDSTGCAVVESWLVHGLSHDYPGGDPRGSFTDPIGPDITSAAWDFFARHRLGALPCEG